MLNSIKNRLLKVETMYMLFLAWLGYSSVVFAQNLVATYGVQG